MTKRHETYKARYELYKSTGRCTNCGQPRENQTKTLCNSCRSKMTARTQKRQAARHKQGLCVVCGNPKEANRQHLKTCLNCRNLKTRRRDKVIQMLGGKCACCGEAHKEFLAIDHKNGNGNQHRKQLGDRGSGKLVTRILQGKEDINDYQVLCHNCNSAKGFYGYCPHQNHK